MAYNQNGHNNKNQSVSISHISVFGGTRFISKHSCPSFMDWMLNLPAELATQFDDFVEQQEAKKKVQYITQIERRARREGHLDGVRDNAKEMLIEALEVRFEDIPANIIEQINTIQDSERLKHLHREAMRCPDLDNFKKRLLS